MTQRKSPVQGGLFRILQPIRTPKECEWVCYLEKAECGIEIKGDIGHPVKGGEKLSFILS
jgi:hypothetical protein